MKSLSSLVAIAALAGCAATSGMSMSFQHTIPRNASVIRLRSNLGPRDLFFQTSNLLIEQGYSFVHIDSSALTLDTDGMPMGNSKTPLRLAIRIQPEDPGSLLEGSGLTLLGPGAWAPAINSTDEKARRGFEEMTLLLGRLPNREISYHGN